MQEFNTAIKEVVEDEKFTQFKVDGREMKAYAPDDGQLAMLLATIGRGSSDQDKVAGLINFFCAVLDDEDATYIEVRLLDRKDPFKLDEVEKIMEWLVEEWGGRPTQPLSVSTPSQESGGPNSTQRTPESNSSDSLLTGS